MEVARRPVNRIASVIEPLDITILLPRKGDVPDTQPFEKPNRGRKSR
jgi:hypothetical protein